MRTTSELGAKMTVNDILRASLKVLFEGEGRETNTEIGTFGKIVPPASLLFGNEEIAEPVRRESSDELSAAPVSSPRGLLLYAPFEEEKLQISSSPSNEASSEQRRSLQEMQLISRLCKRMATEMDGSAAAAVFSISTRKLRGIYLQDIKEEEATPKSVANFASDILRICLDNPLRPFLQEEAQGKNDVEEYFLSVGGAYCFLEIVSHRDTALILMMDDRSQIGRAWFSVRDTKDDFESF
ncbi:MAG: hypothetical protein H6728_00625 [Myxococcales bacterium]|nr:hypothetical protein [Myxococcales bacterium]MCB9641568.1 hypothetical protein [Myxococcales bacterium]